MNVTDGWMSGTDGRTIFTQTYLLPQWQVLTAQSNFQSYIHKINEVTYAILIINQLPSHNGTLPLYSNC